MKRKTFLLQAVSALLSAYPISQSALAATPIANLNLAPTIDKKTEKMPTLFIGHGTPLNAILDNAFTRHLVKLGRELPKPRAIVVVSAHWMAEQTMLSATANPGPFMILVDFQLRYTKYATQAPESRNWQNSWQITYKKLVLGWI